MTNSPTTPVNGMSIPLSSIITTSPQHGLIRASADLFSGNQEDSSEAAVHFYQQLVQCREQVNPNVFLVKAATAFDVLSATSGVLLKGLSIYLTRAKESITHSDINYWMVVYLGAGHSVPTKWIVDDVAVDSQEITMSYHRRKKLLGTADNHQYYYWVPLGSLDQKIYEVALFDADAKATSITRHIDVRRLAT